MRKITSGEVCSISGGDGDSPIPFPPYDDHPELLLRIRVSPSATPSDAYDFDPNDVQRYGRLMP
jgi:hypothetical protein